MIAGLAMSGLLGAALPVGSLSTAVKAGLKTVPGIMSGNFNPVNLGLSALGGSGYVPSWVVPAVKTGMSLSQMYGKG